MITQVTYVSLTKVLLLMLNELGCIENVFTTLRAEVVLAPVAEFGTLMTSQCVQSRRREGAWVLAHQLLLAVGVTYVALQVP